MPRGVLAAAIVHPGLRPTLAQLKAEHFDEPLHRAIRAHLVDGTALDADGIGLYAELDAEAAAEGITLETGEELLVNLRARTMRRELEPATPERRLELTEALRRLREATTGVL